MTAWLLAWNPDNWHWDNYDEDCKAASKENPIELVWSCHSKKPQIGDEFYLMKLGKLPRGIIAHGIVTKGMVPGDRWDGEKKGEILHLSGECDTLLNYKSQKILNVDVLEKECSDQTEWHPQASGIKIKDMVLPKLHELWAEVTKKDVYTTTADNKKEL